jgi:hypothetical protein
VAVKISYENTLADWEAAQAHHLDTWRPFRESVFIWRWGLAAGVAALVVLIPSGTPLVGRALAGLALGSGLYFLYPRSMRTIALDRMRRQLDASGSKPFLPGPRTLQLADDGLHATGPSGSHVFRWSTIAGVDDEAEYLFVRYRTGTLCSPIPRRCFTDEERASFVSELRRRADDAAQLGPPPVRVEV